MAKSTPGKKVLNNQAVRFVLSAGGGFFVDIGVFYLLSKHLDVRKHVQLWFLNIHYYWVIYSVSFFSGVVVNFLITRYFVFTESVTSFTKQFIRFISVAVLGYFANLGMLTFFVEILHLFLPVARI